MLSTNRFQLYGSDTVDNALWKGQTSPSKATYRTGYLSLGPRSLKCRLTFHRSTGWFVQCTVLQDGCKKRFCEKETFCSTPIKKSIHKFVQRGTLAVWPTSDRVHFFQAFDMLPMELLSS